MRKNENKKAQSRREEADTKEQWPLARAAIIADKRDYDGGADVITAG